MATIIPVGPVDFPALTALLREQFPAYRVEEKTENFVMLSKSGAVGASVLFRNDSLIVSGTFPTMLGQGLFALLVIMLAVVIPLIVYYLAFHLRMKSMEKEIATFLITEFAGSAT